MTTIRYVGDHRGGVYLPGDRFVAWGDEADVDDEVAASLLGQRGQFERVDPEPKKSPRSKALADDTTTTDAEEA